MKKFLQKKLNQKGLTLVELLAVIVILGIIAAIAVPSIGNIIENTKYNAVKADATNAINAANMYFAEQPPSAKGEAATVKLSDLESNGYLDSIGKLKGTDTISYGPPKGITATVAYASGKTVTFTNATVESINADKQKGSGTVNAITATTTTQ